MDRQAQLIAVALVLAAAGAGIWFGLGKSPAPAAVATIETGPGEPSSGESGRIVVHVSGWVKAPGLVSLAEGARVAEAVAAAGGARQGAGLAGLNLAAVLFDGDQVIVPGPETSTGAATASDTTDGRVRLNQATAAELEGLPGVGPVLAARIVEHREQFGPFATVEDLLDVSGIGERKLADLRDHLIVP